MRQKYISGAAHPAVARGSHQNSRRYPRTVSRSAQNFRLRGISACKELSVFGGLRGSGEAINRDHNAAVLLQD